MTLSRSLKSLRTLVPTYPRTYSLLTLILTLILTSCSQKTTSNAEVEKLLADLQQTYAPDKRVARFHLELESSGASWVLKGQSDQPKAMAILVDSLKGLGIQYMDSVQQLPAPELEGDTLGVVRLSVANLRSNPGHSQELATQATLGTVVKVLMKQGGWHLVQTPDGYIAWADSGALEHMNVAELEAWKEKSKLVYTAQYGRSKSRPTEEGEIISDLVVGDVLAFLGEKDGYYKSEYPDGREAYIPMSDAIPYDLWMEAMETDEAALTETAHELIGLPYLWGGTSAKGVDCSGFTKTVYFLNGIVLPRDASQQVKSGMLVDEKGDFSKLQPGDLLFFGSYREDGSEKVTHVGMWIGDNQFIHSSGDVHISSMDPQADNYDEFNRNRYFRAKRILGNLTPDVKRVSEVY
ncbi:glycoside hydrolase [Robertkochia marina]|uniref:Glycoside hydrolase n=1 Tax=Robertkochia marina TaxID=1227945 RepID=A0A4S3LZZ8_9FLAO|nr:C40 family peptidase [Robertkochia marina]THD67712.1 glycoside hydrolase [Robertkochia marina]TRZ43443.1 glycoside hydrolase [Robertkochia marina]